MTLSPSWTWPSSRTTSTGVPGWRWTRGGPSYVRLREMKSASTRWAATFAGESALIVARPPPPPPPPPPVRWGVFFLGGREKPRRRVVRDAFLWSRAFPHPGVLMSLTDVLARVEADAEKSPTLVKEHCP